MSTTPTFAPHAATDHKITSGLSDGRQRFLSQVVAHALETGLRTPKDFVRHFSPKAIMLALANQPRLRANVVVPTIGLNEKVALKKSAESLGEDLQIALDEGVVDEEAIVRLFGADDRVRYLDDKKLWAFLVDGDFWKATTGQPKDPAIAKRNIAYIVDCARTSGLITDHDIVEGLTLDRILDALPKTELAKLVRSAVTGGRHGKQFDDEALLGVLPASALLEHIPLPQIWDAVVVSRIALPHGFVVRRSATPPPLPAASDDEEFIVEVVEGESSIKAVPKGHRNRRIDALDLSDLKSEIEKASTSKN
jgi:hypothetical protein